MVELVSLVVPITEYPHNKHLCCAFASTVRLCFGLPASANERIRIELALQSWV